MRSILQEAPSIPKAIEKAWNEAGNPEEFTIKVLDAGEKNFLGFSRRPAIVSIVFEQRKAGKYIKPTKEKEYEEQPRYAHRGRYERGYEQRSGDYRERSYNRSEGRGYRHQGYNNYNNGGSERYERADSDREYYDATWTSESVDDVRSWLKELNTIMNVTTAFTARAENHLLRIEFEKPIFDMPSEERMLFSSFAYVLMQFLKRKHKKKFKGCRLAISSRR